MMFQFSPLDEQGRKRILSLLRYRAIIAGLLLLIAAYFYFQPLPALQRQVLLVVASVFVLLIPLQWIILRTPVPLLVQLGMQFLTDLVLVSGLVFATGGVDSPFAFVFGLIIVAAGSQVNVILILSISVAACVSYLTAVYLYVWHFAASIQVSEALANLLNVSILMLVGGVMAVVARRHAQLQSESRHAIRQHRNLQELHSHVMETMQEGILVLDRQLRIQVSNQAARRLLDRDDSIQNQKLDELISLPEGLENYFRHPKQPVCQCEWERGEISQLLTAIRLSEEDELSTWLLSMVDISGMRSLERKLAEQDKLAALGRMGAMLAHEIRNPLQTIAQAVELMPVRNKARDKEVQSILLEEIQRLNRLVSDMLDYAHPLQPKPRRYHMAELMEVAIQQADMDGKHAIQCDCECDSLKLDADHFRLVLDNLLRNAAAASPRSGTILVRLFPSQKGEWTLMVSDQGKGIPDRVRHHLFEPFVSSRSEGMGLGLATVWQVCQANEWQIQMDTSERGTEFMIRGKASDQARALHAVGKSLHG